jgi:hypothetical protein
MDTTRDRRRIGRIGVLVGAALMALTASSVVAMPAAARRGTEDGIARGGVSRDTSGPCTRRADWELELEKEDGRIDVTVRVHGHRAGRLWRVRIRHDGHLTASVLRRTNTRGRLTVVRNRPDRADTDRFRFRAVDQVSGEVCAGSLSI